MIISKDWIDTFVSKHGRTSCSDNNPKGNQFGGWDGTYSSTTGKKNIRYPRCNRCYLLHHIGYNTNEIEFDIEIHVELVSKIK